MLRDVALGWIRSNIRDERFHWDFARRYDQAVRQGANCYLALGPGVTDTGKPQLMHCFCDELFIFEITPAQARAYNLGAGQVMWGTSRRDKQDAAEPIATISDLAIQGANNLPPDHPIVADLTVDTNGMDVGPCVVRLDYEIPGLRNCVCWHYVDHLPARGRLRCQYLPVQKPGVPLPAMGPLALFFRLCRLPDPKRTDNRQPISNTVADLVCLSC
jgi:hypothetical protein